MRWFHQHKFLTLKMLFITNCNCHEGTSRTPEFFMTSVSGSLRFYWTPRGSDKSFTAQNEQSKLNKNFKATKISLLLKLSSVKWILAGLMFSTWSRGSFYFLFSVRLFVRRPSLLHFLFAWSGRCSLWWRVSAQCIYLYSFLVGLVEFSSTAVFTFILVLL